MRIPVATILLTVLLLCGFAALAQPAGRQQAANTGVLYGKLVDKNSSRSIEGASVQVIQALADSSNRKKKEVILSTQLTDKKGEFNIENLPSQGQLRLRISAVGYKTREDRVVFGKNVIKDLGNIQLSQDAQQLDNVTVLVSKNLLQMSLDKKVYNVEKDISTTGGTAIDIMKNVPSVNVDIDGNVTMRNSTPQIFVDGRPTTLTLDQIPADQVASVEIMTNPSAKFDASGGGSGILNIILKKNRRNGYNGNLRANIDSRGKPGAGGDINIKQQKINFFAGGNYAYRKSVTYVNTDRTDTLNNGLAHYSQINNPVNRSRFGFGRIGLDYLIDNRNTLSISGNVADGTFRVRDIFNIYRDSITNAIFKERALRTLAVKAGFRNYGTAFGFKHNFARPDRELTIDGNFNYSDNYNTSDYNNLLFDSVYNPKPAQGAQRATGGGHSRLLTVQTDYVDPFTETKKIELGLRAAFRDYNNWNDNYIQNVNSSMYVLLPAIGVRYNYTDMVLAGYASWSQQINKISYQVGLRIESSEYKGNYISRNQSFSNSYPFSLFPSAFVSYKLTENQDLQFNYSRKISRPGFFQLVPFVDFSDSLNLTVGNPNLRPEFTHLAEIADNYQYGKGNSLLVSIYGKLTEDLITRYQFIDATINPMKPARYTSYANARNSTTLGLEITGRNRINSWWDLTSNLNFFHVNIKADNLSNSANNKRFSWFGKLNMNFRLPANYSIQLSGDYQGKTILPAGSPRGGSSGGYSFGSVQTTAQGYIKPYYGTDLAIKKEFGKNNAASLTLQCSDLLRTRLYSTYADGLGFVQNNSRRRDPQVVRLNFNWRFGKFDMALLKRKNSKSDLDNLQNLPNQ
ncbi:outer membrane beta-barrel family protein [Ferruginibacter sp. HRS2-29]|uniref:outer membrane beta-barrel family protein n=1 Tax=Ferruginibacter sp. HRS2-29 TaxID=2487334 RepID=UPI0020CF59AF|nr:outer membrane beta-barrel family protein [Ferruginibacter sp. HRS2-29]MCP9750914.1 TonB-dependent receptor [Ferruginibacter sp. HRS2-29]